jgi:hypothetical protein
MGELRCWGIYGKNKIKHKVKYLLKRRYRRDKNISLKGDIEGIGISPLKVIFSRTKSCKKLLIKEISKG